MGVIFLSYQPLIGRNPFRLNRHVLWLNLLIRLRSELPDPPDPETLPRECRCPAPVRYAKSPHPPTGRELRRDQMATWRLRSIKVAEEVIVSARQVLVRLSSALAQPADVATRAANGVAELRG